LVLSIGILTKFRLFQYLHFTRVAGENTYDESTRYGRLLRIYQLWFDTRCFVVAFVQHHPHTVVESSGIDLISVTTPRGAQASAYEAIQLYQIHDVVGLISAHGKQWIIDGGGIEQAMGRFDVE
jgi:hypothetical protein